MKIIYSIKELEEKVNNIVKKYKTLPNLEPLIKIQKNKSYYNDSIDIEIYQKREYINIISGGLLLEIRELFQADGIRFYHSICDDEKSEKCKEQCEDECTFNKLYCATIFVNEIDIEIDWS